MGAARGAWIFVVSLTVLTTVWYVLLVARFHTAGAIGNDPTTYVQMALDLAQRGTPTHIFPLFNSLIEQGLSWDAFITPGYRIVRETGAIAPVFAFGFPLMLALAYRAFGEGALYWMTPFLGALSLIATFALANELLRGQTWVRRYVVGALAVMLLATTPKQIVQVLVPMSDIAAQLFAVLGVWCAVQLPSNRIRRLNMASEETGQARHSSPALFFYAWSRIPFDIVLALLCGFFIGFGYLVRHSGMIVIVPVAVIAAQWGGTRRQRWLLGSFALAAFALTILPDVIYRAQVLGSIFAVESPESVEVIWTQVPSQVFGMAGALVSVTGFGPSVVLAPLGLWVMAYEGRRIEAWALVVWILGFVLFHAPLRLTGVFENDLRYLLPAYPAFAITIAFGTVWLASRSVTLIRNSRSRFSVPALGFYTLVLITVLSAAIAGRALFSPDRFAERAYGRMTPEARRDFDALREQLPPNAVIGVSDQLAGAVLLYTERDIFRPASFRSGEAEFSRFMDLMRTEGHSVFLLGDWNCPPTADGSERLPEWIGKLKIKDWRLEIEGLPYECRQRVYEVK